MSSNSLRISTELFDQAQRQGQLLSRSAAQQVEHWARLGAALEASGLTVPQLVALLRDKPAGGRMQVVPEAELWAFKRARQRRDMELVASGRASSQAMGWFSGEQARRAKVIGAPF